MITIRLQRFGKKNQPSFRVVVTDKRNGPRSGNAREVVGWVNPREHNHSFNKERVLYWLSVGAQTSGTVHNMLVRDGVIKGKKIDVSPKEKHKEGDSENREKTEEKSVDKIDSIKNSTEADKENLGKPDKKEEPIADTIPENSGEANKEQEEEKPANRETV